MKSQVLAYLLLAVFSGAHAANILFVNNVPSPSHHIYNRVIVLGLAEKGHNVTFLSADIVEKKTSNVHYLHLEKIYVAIYEMQKDFSMQDFADQSPLASVREMGSFEHMMCESALHSEGLDQLLAYPKDFKFDLILYDFTMGPCLLPLVSRFNNPPLVSVSAFANPPYTTDYIGGQKYPAYVPHYVVNYQGSLTFTERFFNTFLYFADWL